MRIFRVFNLSCMDWWTNRPMVGRTKPIMRLCIREEKRENLNFKAHIRLFIPVIVHSWNNCENKHIKWYVLTEWGVDLWAPTHPSLLLIYKILRFQNKMLFIWLQYKMLFPFLFISLVVTTEDSKEDCRR